MNVEQRVWQTKDGWQLIDASDELSGNASIAFVLGPVDLINKKSTQKEISSFYPKADIVYCSSLSSFINGQILSEEIVVLAMSFEKAKTQVVSVDASKVKDSFDAGTHLSANLEKDNLKGVVLLSGALPSINPSHLMKGILFNIAEHIPITGGTASSSHGDPVVGLNGEYNNHMAVAVGFYGENLKFGHGIDDAWTSFGTERFVTKSKDNTVYKLDNMTPLELYKMYLEGLVENLEEAVPHFPLGIRMPGSDRRLVRGVIKLHKDTGAVSYAGDIPEGSRVRMMKSNVSKLIDSASFAAKRSRKPFDIDHPDCSLVFDCKSRQQVLNEWAPEELEAMTKKLGTKGPVVGFYSSGEFAPMKPGKKSELQNQTTTITTIKED